MHRIMTVPQLCVERSAAREVPQALVSSSAVVVTRRSAATGLVLAVVLSLLPAHVHGQAETPQLGIIISVGGNERRKLSTGKKIKRVTIGDQRIVNVTPISPEEVIITGTAPGISKVSLLAEDDKIESFDIVVVLFDIRQLEQVLRQAVPTGNIRAVPAGNNGVILRGTVDRVEDLTLAVDAARSVVGGAQIINGLRVGGVQQVQLDVVVARVSRSEFRSMAFNFFANSRNFYFGSTVGQAVLNPVQAGVGGLLSPTNFPSQALAGVPGTPSGVPTNILSGVLHNGWGFLHFLEALRQEGLLKLMAEPRLVTMSGRQASFLDGGEQAIPVPAGLGQVGVQFEEFGTRLNFIPVVLGNGKIHLEVEPEVSALDPTAGTSINGTIVPGRTTQRIRTTVEIESGQTFVIGGLIQHSVNAITQKVPLLGDLPFIGTAFSSKSFTESESELLILVTPHLVDPIDCSQYPCCLPGQETRTPDDFELFLEGILEAPRGPREVCQGKVYVPAYKNGPTAALFPCAGNGHRKHPGHHGGAMKGNGFCFGGQCPTCPGGTAVRMHTAQKMPDGGAARPVSHSDAGPGTQKPETLEGMPLTQTPGTTLPASLPAALEGPVLPRP